MFVIVQLYHKLKEFDDQYRDRRVDNVLFVNNALYIIAVIALYYVFVMHLGPRLMKNRQPFELKWIMLSYNALQVVGNLLLALKGISAVVRHWELISICMMPIVEENDAGKTEFTLSFFYVLLKFVDLLDTVFFVLRKRDKQITFLHVYHHMLMAAVTYALFRYLPGGHGIIVGILNACVHTVMYLYYFISALRPELKQSLWWKKHITQIQIAQFVIVLSCSTIAFCTSDCRYPKVILGFIVIEDIVMLSLFGNFYYVTYLLKSKQTTQSKAMAGASANDLSMGEKAKES